MVHHLTPNCRDCSYKISREEVKQQTALAIFNWLEDEVKYKRAVPMPIGLTSEAKLEKLRNAWNELLSDGRKHFGAEIKKLQGDTK